MAPFPVDMQAVQVTIWRASQIWWHANYSFIPCSASTALVKKRILRVASRNLSQISFLWGGRILGFLAATALRSCCAEYHCVANGRLREFRGAKYCDAWRLNHAVKFHVGGGIDVQDQG